MIKWYRGDLLAEKQPPSWPHGPRCCRACIAKQLLCCVKESWLSSFLLSFFREKTFSTLCLGVYTWELRMPHMLVAVFFSFFAFISTLADSLDVISVHVRGRNSTCVSGSSLWTFQRHIIWEKEVLESLFGNKSRWNTIVCLCWNCGAEKLCKVLHRQHTHSQTAI